ncbi:MAG TPA: HAD-IIIC family phosphatase [Thermoanaerobaculia bacterium]|jgi:FkbH-like protein|nr:HAD-IIIC family phosphatase [Thermoanaerobaculia bacterium]
MAVKCVVWDLDNTVWDGILLEDPEVRLRPHVVHILKTLDERGILHSIASRNDHDLAMAKLRELGLDDYFLYPQVNWNSKADSIARIAQDLNLALDAFAFVDDQPFEREEVAFSHAGVLCLDSALLDDLLDRPEFNPRFITEDSRLRRRMYQADFRRNREEADYVGPKEEFLATLGMVFTIAPCREEDLKRAEELTVRTHQLNTTGYTYSYEELDALRQSPRHELLIASLEDRHGAYGKIGLSLVEKDEGLWTVKLLLMSCRVMSKGVGTILIHHLLRRAKAAGVRLRAELVDTGRNRQMLITYRFAGFKEIGKTGDVSLLENDFTALQPPPPYVDLRLL